MVSARSPLRVAVVGCGWAGRRHALALRGLGAEVSWLVDVNVQRARVLSASLPGAAATADFGRVLSDSRVDAVVVCLPHALHARFAVESARAGKHVLVEKPLAASLDEADQMIETADRAGVTLMVAENERFKPLNAKLRDLVRSGAIGEPALVQATRECYLARSFLAERRWFLDEKAAAGGIMMSGGVHDFEKLRMIVGEIVEVHAMRARQRFSEMQGDDTSVALVRFENGAVGTLVESFLMKSLATASGPEVHFLRIDGDLGSAAVLDRQTIRVFSEREGYLLAGGIAQHDVHVPDEDSFVVEDEHFLESLRSGSEPLTSGRSQRRPLEIVLAAYQSMRTNLPVRLT